MKDLILFEDLVNYYSGKVGKRSHIIGRRVWNACKGWFLLGSPGK